MELKNRKSLKPGRIRLKNVNTNVVETYELEFADEPTEVGTPLNKDTLVALKEEILNEARNFNSTTVYTSETPLTCNCVINVSGTADSIEQPVVISTNAFNRTPKLGESFVGVFHATVDNGQTFEESSFISVCSVQTIGLTNNLCKVTLNGQAATGIGIKSISLSDSDANGGNVYTITLSDNRTFTFTAPKGSRGEKGTDGSGIYLSSQAFSAGVSRYDVAEVNYNKSELAAGDLVLSSANGIIVRVRSLSEDGFKFIGEYAMNLKE